MDVNGRIDKGIQRHRGKNTGLYNRGGQRENSSKWNEGKHSKENTAKKRQTSGHNNEKIGMENRNTTWKKRNVNNEPNRDRRSIQKQEENNTEHDKQEEKNRKKWKKNILHTRMGTQETRRKQYRQIHNGSNRGRR